MENSRELFIKAFMESEQRKNALLPCKDESEWAFSAKFEKSMNRLVQKNKRIQLSTRRTVTKSLLAAIITILVIFTTLMSVSATRKPIIEFVKKVFSQFNEITLSKELPPPVETIQTEYTLTNLPEGYEISNYQKSVNSVFIIWTNESGEEIVFSQELLDSDFTIDNEYGYRELEINGLKAYLTEDEYGGVLRWSDGDYCFAIKVPVSIKSDIIKLQENICEKN